MLLPVDDPFSAEAHGPLSDRPLALVELDDAPDLLPAPIIIGIDRAGVLPDIDPAPFTAFVTTRPDAPAPWVSVSPDRIDAQLAAVQHAVAACPHAATIFTRVLRITGRLPFADALEVESLAYSALLAGDEFRRWRAAHPATTLAASAGAPVRYERARDHVTLTLAAPATRNAMDAAMRDALWELLANIVADPSLPSVTLRAEGRCFSAGGDLAEFGSAGDLAAAHHIRTARSAALLLMRLGERASVYLHGACIGSGIEIPAAAARRTGAADLIVQLPELRMGLMPGAGGTVTLARAIGRHRLAWLVLGGFRIGARRALDWGLIHAVSP